MQKAIVIIPTYNERQNIQKVVPALEEVFAAVKTWQLGILVVDDTSPDKTADAVKTLQKKYDNLHLLVNKEKAGLGAAYLKGMDEAFGPLKADVIFEFDADLSHDPKRLPDFLAALDNGADVVQGSRYMKGGGIPATWGIHRKFLSVVGNIVIRIILSDFRIHDWTSGYRALTKKVFTTIRPELVTDHQLTSYTFQTGSLHKAVKAGFKVREVPFVFADREIGESKLGFESVTDTLGYIMKIRLQEIVNHRVFKFVVVGGLGALIQLISLKLWWLVFPYNLASFFSIECAVVSNFILSNLWTFADRKLSLPQVPVKFVQFNLASAGSILIQLAIAFAGNFLIGANRLLLTVPVINFGVKWGLVFSVIGIFVGMFWNFFAYSRLVWKKK